MKKLSVLALAMLCLIPGALLAGHHEQAEDHAAEMEEWVAANMPGEHHEHLGRMVGHWTYTTTGSMGDSEGTMHAKSVFDGRYVMHTWNGSFMGQDFVGHGLDGYDNALGKYVGVWVDNSSTGIQVSHGKCANEECSETVSKSEMTGPDGNMMKSKSHMVWDGNDSFTMTMYMVPEEGDPVEQMTLVATRHDCDENCELHGEHHGDKHAKHAMKAAEAEMAKVEAEMEVEMEEASEAMAEAEEAMEMAEDAMEDAQEAMEDASEAMESGDE